MQQSTLHPSIPAILLTIALLEATSVQAQSLRLGQDDAPVPGSPAALQEEKDTREVADSVLKTLQSQKRNRPNEIVRRDAHPKAHGCVKARFTVSPNLPLELRQGIFQQPREFKAWIRYSNGSPNSFGRPDSKGDARGMAMKLVGIPAGLGTPADQRLLPGDERNTQDFVLSNHPVFFIRNPHDYVQFMKSKIIFFGRDAIVHSFHTKEILDETAAEPATNPFQLDYFSQTPYRFGPAAGFRAVKYKVTPVSCDGEVLERTERSADPNFLHEAMVNSMKKGDVCFAFGLQFQADPITMQITDSTLLWDENQSRFLPVAKIRIRKDENDGKIDNEQRVNFCENISMSPWHGIEAHHPMGGINRVRKTVYLTISGFRRAANGVAPFEPTGEEKF